MKIIVQDDQKLALLTLARDSLKAFLDCGERISVNGYLNYPMDKSIHGAFVSVYCKKDLRGCMGKMNFKGELAELVRDMSIESAIFDNRFDPILLNEFGSVSFEITLVTAEQKITDISKIIPGKHGITIKKGNKIGTFLPQVAPRMGWDAIDLLRHCARDKAHIGWEGWKHADIFVYESICFTDDNA